MVEKNARMITCWRYFDEIMLVPILVMGRTSLSIAFCGGTQMCVNNPNSVHMKTDLSLRNGFAESHFEHMLRDSIRLAAALTGGQAALVLQDEAGIWYRDGSGLTREQLSELTATFSPGSELQSTSGLAMEHGIHILEALPLMDDCHRSLGTLYALSSDPMVLTETQKNTLCLLAEHVQTIVAMDKQKSESRLAPRAPSAASFVPGLVHELGSFIFGISANLDAFEARFAEVDEVGTYAVNIRRSLDRMSAFIVELREYGYPQRLSWTRIDLGALLKQAVEFNLPLAGQNHVELRLQIDGALPAIEADEDTLRTTFIRMIDLVLRQEEAGGHVVLHVATRDQGNNLAICGSLECSSTKYKDVDPARLFEPFYFRVSGLGRLTLPGARRVMESHGGTLSASPGPNGGIWIRFMLPSELTNPLRAPGQP